MKKIFSLLAGTMIFSVAAFADIRPPLPPPPSATPDSKTNKPTLQIPQSAVKNLRAQPGAIDDGSSTVAATFGSFNLLPIQTLISGLFMSLAIIFGGVMILRKAENSVCNR